ncbi:DUF4168 domain-containing protein [Thalassospira xianhensis]|uniref:DUF4168 domain-containing protein n=1 Tax=Thalassospira xianhensis MCCC 1A02616 TaxID=1177929 RepID=A0A367UEH5_9PROT|nr:DUF4168 domain-containing protein [Thalassospira xianhensis]RCK06725.1 hypothetical protein TH5_06130 [Thalassospira xianhensis MCCC 1A02616]
MKCKVLVPVAFALWAASPLITSTSEAQAQGTQPEQAAPAVSYSDSQLQGYAAVAVEVRDLNDKWQKRAQESTDPAKVQKIRQQASAEMVQAIRDEGLSIKEYNEITQAALQNPELSERINSFVE